jgi:hypothetical protein
MLSYDATVLMLFDVSKLKAMSRYIKKLPIFPIFFKFIARNKNIFICSKPAYKYYSKVNV